jgi:hypothetical protein
MAKTKVTEYKGHTIQSTPEGRYEIVTMKGTSTPHPLFAVLRLAKAYIDRAVEREAMRAHGGKI